MRKLYATLAAVGSVVGVSLLTPVISHIVLILVALGFTGLINQAVPILGAVLGVLLVFAAAGAINIEVNFVQLLL